MRGIAAKVEPRMLTLAMSENYQVCAQKLAELLKFVRECEAAWPS
jgi:hypothetical protein